MSLGEVLSSKSLEKIGTRFNLQGAPAQEMKWQPLIITAKRVQIESCTIGAKVDSESMHFHWPYPGIKIEPNGFTVLGSRSEMSLNPDDPVQLIVWYALKTADAMEDKERFYFVTDSTIPIDVGPRMERWSIEIMFYSKIGKVNKKPFRLVFHAGSWSKLGLETVKGHRSSLKDRLSFLCNLRSRSHSSIMALRPRRPIRVKRTV